MNAPIPVSCAADCVADFLMLPPADPAAPWAPLSPAAKRAYAHRASLILEQFRAQAETRPCAFVQDMFATLTDRMVTYAADAREGGV